MESVPESRPRRFRARWHRPGLRAQVTIFFLLTGLVVSMVLSVITYLVARNYLVDQRERAARNEALTNAALVQTRVRDLSYRGLPASEALDAIGTERDGFALLVLTNADGSTTRVATRSPLEVALPKALLDQVNNHHLTGTELFRLTAPAAQFSSLNGQPYLGVGVALPSVTGAYFEAFPLAGSQRTLGVVGTALFIASAVTTAAAAGLGLWNSRRLMRPISRVADVASELAAGALDVRLDPEDDPDLSRLATSFNAMADAVQTRIQREARFASDVSHELRSPITALAAAVDVLDARRADIPGRAGQALEVVVNQVRRFDQMVLDLLELSRLDAGASELNIEPLRLDDTVRRIAHRFGYPAVPIVTEPGADHLVAADKLRLERIVANLLDNASLHAGGPVKISIEPGGTTMVHLVVHDAGPGVPEADKSRIFERFARGSSARRGVGTGLGLALVQQHASALGGQAWVEDRPGGGSRFVVALPIEQEP